MHTWKWAKLEFNLDGKPLCECGEERLILRTDLKTAQNVFGAMETRNRGGKFPVMSDCEKELRSPEARTGGLYGPHTCEN